MSIMIVECSGTRRYFTRNLEFAFIRVEGLMPSRNRQGRKGIDNGCSVLLNRAQTGRTPSDNGFWKGFYLLSRGYHRDADKQFHSGAGSLLRQATGAAIVLSRRCYRQNVVVDISGSGSIWASRLRELVDSAQETATGGASGGSVSGFSGEKPANRRGASRSRAISDRVRWLGDVAAHVNHRTTAKQPGTIQCHAMPSPSGANMMRRYRGLCGAIEGSQRSRGTGREGEEWRRDDDHAADDFRGDQGEREQGDEQQKVGRSDL
jgi:hypothetical protein